MAENGKFKLGEWTVEPDLDRISRGDTQISLQPQNMDLLVYLAQHRKEVISTDQLLEHVWKGRVVTSASVYSSLKLLREALGDDVHKPRYITTIPKRGYRLIAPVVYPGVAKFPKRMVALLASGIFATIALTFLYRTDSMVEHEEETDRPSGQSLTASEYTADELHLQAVKLIEQNTKNTLMTALSMLERAIEMQPDFADAHVAIATAYLNLSSFDGYYAPGTAFEESRKLSESHINRALEIDPKNAAAYLKMSEIAVAADPTRLQALERALSLDPNLYQAHLQMGVAKMSYLLPWNEIISHLDKAVEIEPHSIEAATTLVMFLPWVPHRWEEAETIIANLSLSEPESIDIKMMKAIWLLNPRGRPSEAIPILEEILVLDPDHIWAKSFLAKAWFTVGEIEQASKMPGGIIHWRYVLSPDRQESLQLLNSTEKQPDAIDFGRRIVSSYAYVMLHDWKSAVDLLEEEAQDLENFTSIYVENFGLNESPAMSLAVAYRALGDQAMYRRFAELERKAINIRTTHGQLHNIEYSRAMARLNALEGNYYQASLELERLITQGPNDPRELLHPAFDDMHDMPRFHKLIKLQRQRVNKERAIIGLPPLGSEFPPIFTLASEDRSGRIPNR